MAATARPYSRTSSSSSCVVVGSFSRFRQQRCRFVVTPHDIHFFVRRVFFYDDTIIIMVVLFVTRTRSSGSSGGSRLGSTVSIGHLLLLWMLSQEFDGLGERALVNHKCCVGMHHSQSVRRVMQLRLRLDLRWLHRIISYPICWMYLDTLIHMKIATYQ